MSFLAPLFLLGGLAIVWPIVFHMIRRSTRERQPFSAMMFLEPTPPKITRKSRIENWFLLLLRCLVFLLVALAFARPYLKAPVEAPDPSEERRRFVLLIDRSASMKRGDLWDQAKRKVVDRARGYQAGDSVAVWAFDARLERVMGFEEWRETDPGAGADSVAERLAGLEPTWFHTDLGAALAAAADSFDEADIGAGGDEARFKGEKRIVVVSDMQEGARLEAIQAYDWPDDVVVTVDAVEASAVGNAHLRWAPVAEAVGEDRQSSQARVLVSNSDDSPQNQFQLYWSAARRDAVDVYVPAGQSRVVHSPAVPSARGAEDRSLVLSGDSHDFDNAVHVVLPKSSTATILYQGDDAATDPNGALFYLKRALAGSVRPTIELIARRSGEPFTPAELDAASLLVVAGAVADAEAATQMLERGRSVLISGFEALSSRALAPVFGGQTIGLAPAAVRDYALLGDIRFAHPIFAPFAEARFSDFTTIHFWKYARMAEDRLEDARVLARFDSGDPALIEAKAGNGGVFLLAAGWRPSQSQLARSTKFVPLLFSFLEYRGVRRTDVTPYSVGDSLPAREVLGSRNAVTVTKPDASSQTMSGVDAYFDDTDQPGVYVAEADGERALFAVNLDPRESQTTRLESDHLAAYGVAAEAPATDYALSEEDIRLLANTELEKRQKGWRWLLAAALFVIILETALAGRLTRRPQTA